MFCYEMGLSTCIFGVTERGIQVPRHHGAYSVKWTRGLDINYQYEIVTYEWWCVGGWGVVYGMAWLDLMNEVRMELGLGYMVLGTNPRLAECAKLNWQSQRWFLERSPSPARTESAWRGFVRYKRFRFWESWPKMPPNRRSPRGENWIRLPVGLTTRDAPEIVQAHPLHYVWPQCWWVTIVMPVGQLLRWKSSTQATLKFLSPHSGWKAKVRNKSLLGVTLSHHDQSVLVREERAKRKIVPRTMCILLP